MLVSSHNLVAPGSFAPNASANAEPESRINRSFSDSFNALSDFFPTGSVGGLNLEAKLYDTETGRNIIEAHLKHAEALLKHYQDRIDNSKLVIRDGPVQIDHLKEQFRVAQSDEDRYSISREIDSYQQRLSQANAEIDQLIVKWPEFLAMQTEKIEMLTAKLAEFDDT
jgi:chromosome segregation ATPase